MEALAQKLQDALGPDIAVYLGSEWLNEQPTIPHVIVIPAGGTYRPPDGSVRFALADVEQRTAIICKAMLFEEATLLAEAAYAAVGESGTAEIKLRTEVWGDYNVRVADLTVTLPAVLTRDDVTLVRVKTFTQHAQFTINPSTEEVPNGEKPAGITVFEP